MTRPELTREMCYELIDRIVVGSAPKTEGEDRVIDIIYKVDIASVLRYKLKKITKKGVWEKIPYTFFHVLNSLNVSIKMCYNKHTSRSHTRTLTDTIRS